MVWKSTDMAGLWDEVTTINYKDAADPADGAVDRVLDYIMAESLQEILSI